MTEVYLDHNTTTPVHSAVVEAMSECLRDVFGDPSSLHQRGSEACRAVDRARRQVAALIGAEPSEIVFVSGGTEADNLALRGIVGGWGDDPAHIVTTTIEHPAILEACRRLERARCRVTYVPVSDLGMVQPDAVVAATTDDTVLVSVMLANNEVGTLQPVAEIASALRPLGIPVHTDAVQAVGKIPVNVDQLGVDLLSLSGHKMYGPKGVGALYVRRGTPLAPLILGGHQESCCRGGTENVPGIVGLGTACELAHATIARTSGQVGALRDHLEREILSNIEDAHVNGHFVHRLPNTLNVSFDGVNGEVLALRLDQANIAASTGSARGSRINGPSHVLTSMGLGPTRTAGAIRLSLGAQNTWEEIDRTVEALKRLVAELRGTSRTRSAFGSHVAWSEAPP